MNQPAFGKVVKEADILKAFLDSPGEFIVANTLLQLSKVPQYVELFGKYTPLYDADKHRVGVNDLQRWTDYQRTDWSMRQLPAISVFESNNESKQSSNGWLTGNISIQVYWPASQRRSDWSRVHEAFKGTILNFFESALVRDMLDEHFSIKREEKVAGLNEYGKEITWTPNVEGLVENQFVPVTVIDIRYRVDLRAWYRFLEEDYRTKDQPFERTLADLVELRGEILGTINKDVENPQIIISDAVNLD